MITTAIYSVTENGLKISIKLQKGLKGCDIFASEKFKTGRGNGINYIEASTLKETVKSNWSKYKNHIFIMATGIVVRMIAPLLESKIKDPAVICCDDMENYAISLVSGHIGGANELVRRIAAISKYTSVITTASDIRNLNSIDEFAVQNGWKIENPKCIKYINSAAVEGKEIGLVSDDKKITNCLTSAFPTLKKYRTCQDCASEFIVEINGKTELKNKKILWITTNNQ